MLKKCVKIIFLDFDGVLCNRESIEAGYKARQSPEDDPYGAHADCVAAFNHIIEETGALIVVSSSWRYIGLAAIQSTLKRWGIKGEVIDITPKLSWRETNLIPWSRGAEIKKWLDNTTLPISSFIIIDDDSDIQPLLDRHIHTVSEIGLTMTEAVRAISMLNKG
jgi:hypothetical protein